MYAPHVRAITWFEKITEFDYIELIVLCFSPDNECHHLGELPRQLPAILQHSVPVRCPGLGPSFSHLHQFLNSVQLQLRFRRVRSKGKKWKNQICY